MACRYVTDRDETLVAQALATSSGKSQHIGREKKKKKKKKHTGAIVVGLEQGKNAANGKHVCVFFKNHGVGLGVGGGGW